MWPQKCRWCEEKSVALWTSSAVIGNVITTFHDLTYCSFLVLLFFREHKRGQMGESVIKVVHFGDE